MTRRSSLSYPKFSARKSMSSGVARWSYNSLYSLSFIEKARRSARSGITKRRVSLKACGLGAAKRRTCGEVPGRLKPAREDGGRMAAPDALRTDLVDNKTLTFSETEYGVRLVVRTHLRSKDRRATTTST